MKLYADPRRCPDCGQGISPADPSCAACGLPLRGRTAQQLYTTLLAADRLLAELRASRGAATTASPSWRPGPAPQLPVGAAASRPVHGGRGLSAASVPKILLGLGAACLLVAALVFLAVTWSVLGVGGRTATLVLFTAVAGVLAGWMGRRDLRGAAEALSLVALGLLTLDVVGARHAGWLGSPSTPTFLAVLGAVLLGAGGGACRAARRTPVGRLVAPEVVAAAGACLVVVGVGDARWLPDTVAPVLAVLVGAAMTYAAQRVGLRIVAATAAAMTAVAWLGQLLHALDSTRSATVAQLWGGFEAWQLLVSAALVGSVAAVRALPLAARVTAASVGYAVLTLTVVLPVLDQSVTDVVLVALAALVVAGILGWVAPGPWGLTAAVTQAVAGVAALAGALSVAGLAARRLAEVTSAGWQGGPGDRLVGEVPADVPAPWVAVPCVVALLVTLLVVGRAAPSARRLLVPESTDRSTLGVLAATIVATSAVAALAAYPVPVWTVLATLLLLAGALLARWLLRPAVTALLLAAVALAAGVAVGLYDEWLTVPALTALLLAAGTVHLRAAETELSAVAGALAAAAVAGSVWTWGALVGGSGTWVALVGLLVLAGVALTSHLYPGEWWSCPFPVWARAGVEAGAAASALPVALAGALAAGVDRPSWVAVYLTVAGAATVSMALLRDDRRALAWPGGALLAAASWVRLWDLGVRAPEAYTLPTAVVLVGLGVLHLRRHPEADSLTALAPGLGLALVPSLLWVVAEPTGLRSLLLGLACLGLVGYGVRLRWSAPLVLGAAVGAALLVRLAAPYVGDAVPRWVLIGTAGVLLVAAGITWERRLHEARALAHYVHGLR